MDAALPSEATSLTTRIETRTVDGGEVAVVTCFREDGKPAAIGPCGIAALRTALAEAVATAQRDGLLGVVVTGTGKTFLAGADLEFVAAHGRPEVARALGEAGHALIGELLDAPVPVVALVNGTALGGGLEVAIACAARVVADDVRSLGTPEAHLGLVAGWGGSFLLPHLVGPANAAKLLLENPLKNNRFVNAAGALEMGLADVVVPASRDEDGEIAWPAAELGALLAEMPRSKAPETSEFDETEWTAAADGVRARVERAVVGGRPAPGRALELFEAARTNTRAEAFAAEDQALEDLVPTAPMQDTLYAMDLLRRYRPKRAEAPIGKLGVIGGGLMATQLGSLIAGALRIPVVFREIDEARAARTRDLLEQCAADARTPELTELFTVTTDLAELADADLVIEAVFEEMTVKKQVFAEIEPLLREEAILATNTSALSISEMAEGLARPERLVGIHFFNPVAKMPLVEVVSTPHTSEEVRAMAHDLAHALGKSTIDVADAPGFVVNRVLVRLLATAVESLERGTPPRVVATALDPIGLPMGPLHLLQLVGPAVANHVLHTLHAELGPRYPLSPGLDRIVEDGASFLAGPPSAATPINAEISAYFTGSEPESAEDLLVRARLELAEEIRFILDEGVATREAIDVAMILGAGWPLHRGGITPYLNETGAAQQAAGRV